MAYATNLTEGSVLKKYIFFIVPIILSGFLQQLYNTADTMVVGKFAGDAALAAVGATAALTNLILNLFLGLAIGTNVVCSRYYGAEDKEGLSKAVHTSILLALVSGVFLAFVGVFFSRNFLMWMSTPHDVIEGATIYMQVYFLGAPASLVYNFGAAILRAAGDTKRPLYILATAGIVNVVLNLVCVIVLELGVVGVAIGTIASQVLSAISVIIILIRTNSEFKLKLNKLKIHKKVLCKILAIGIPSGLNGIMYSLSNVILQTTINSFGKSAVAANVAASNVEIFGFLVLSSAEQGVVSFVGQNIGAKKYDRAEKVTKIAMLTSFVGAIIVAFLVVSFGPVLLGFFADSESINTVVGIGMVRMTIIMYSYVLQVPNQILSGTLKGMGRAVEPTVINAVFVCLMRVIWIFFVYPIKPALEMVYYSYPVTWGLSSVAMIVIYILVKRKVFVNK